MFTFRLGAAFRRVLDKFRIAVIFGEPDSLDPFIPNIILAKKKETDVRFVYDSRFSNYLTKRKRDNHQSHTDMSKSIEQAKNHTGLINVVYFKAEMTWTKIQIII